MFPVIIPFRLFAEVGTYAHCETVGNKVGQAQDQNDGSGQAGPCCGRYHGKGGDGTVDSAVNQFSHIPGYGQRKTRIRAMQRSFVLMMGRMPRTGGVSVLGQWKNEAYSVISKF